MIVNTNRISAGCANGAGAALIRENEEEGVYIRDVKENAQVVITEWGIAPVWIRNAKNPSMLSHGRQFRRWNDE